MRETKDKYRCANCGKLRHLVITRNRAVLCKQCYEENLAKRKALRELNRIANQIIKGK